MNSNFNDLIPTGASNNENQLELKKKTDELIKKDWNARLPLPERLLKI